MIVVDASVLATALADDDAGGRRVRERLAGERLAAPELLDLEVISAFRRLCAAGTLTAERAEAAVIDLHDLRVQRVPHRPLLDRCWELRKNVTVYDAAYIALAESLDVTLLTADRRLVNAPGAQCSFELVM
ncbi:MAG TPA: type II toxin-antitoxin system VapC family toxin [Acidimicrobiales bacterium]|nr:type II toxin-antitoxin system VapC family toxin [Acidimicrobiales bacterium]